MVKILIVGSKGANIDILEALRNRGFEVEYTHKIKIPRLLQIKNFDVIYGLYLQTCSRYIAAAEILGKKSIIHFVGSDAYRYAKEKGLRKIYWETIINACDRVFYVSPHLMDLVKRKGAILPLPINMKLEKFRTTKSPKRDILYYCPSGAESARIYRLNWILEYALQHSDETITIIGNQAHPADYKPNLPNVKVIPFVPYKEMRTVYLKHKKLIRMTTQDGLPKMVDEAFLCGLEVLFNGEKITQISPERNPEIFSQRFEEELLRIV